MINEQKGDYIVEWNIDGFPVIIGITPIEMKKTIEAFMVIPGMMIDKAKVLFRGGYTTLDKLAEASSDDLQKLPGIPKTLARKISAYFERLAYEESTKIKIPSGGGGVTGRTPETGIGTVELSKGEMIADEESQEEFIKSVLEQVNVTGLGPSKIRAIYMAGFNTMEKLRNATFEELSNIRIIGKYLAKEILKALGRTDIEEEVKPFIPRAPEPTPMKVTVEITAPTPPIQTPEIKDTKYEIRDTKYEMRKPEEQPTQQQVIQVPVTQAPPPEPETKGETHGVPSRLNSASIYLIKEERSDNAYHIFKSNLTRGIPGLCISRSYPEKIKEKFHIDNASIVWLSNVGKESSIRPKDLEKLSLSIEQFLSKNKNALILLDGVEYLITNNNFTSVLKLVQSLRDIVSINQATLIIPINPKTVESSQISLIEKEVDFVI